MPKLFLRLTSEPLRVEEDLQLAVEWLVREDDGEVRGEGTTDARGLGEIVDVGAAWAQDPANIVAFVPAENVLTVTCRVPGRSVSQVRRALPFAVEEFLTDDIETLHLAHGRIQRGEPVTCVLTDRATLRAWLDALGAAGIHPGYMASDAQLLPAGENRVSVLVEADSALIRTPDQMANIDLPLLPDVLGAVSAGLEDPELTLVNGRLSAIDASQSGFRADKIETVHLSGSVLGYLAERWVEAQPEINLLQGGFAPPRRRSTTATKWRSAAALAAVWALVAVGVFVAEGFWADLRADQIQAETFSLYRNIYPNEARVRNPYRQMRGKLGQTVAAGDGAGFHALLGQLAVAMDRTVKGTALKNLRFSENRGELAAEIWIAGYDRLDALKDQLTKQGVGVEITSAEQQESQVRASLRLRAGA